MAKPCRRTFFATFVLLYQFRIENAARGKSVESLKARVSIESLLLQSYGVKLPARQGIVPAGPIDRVSVGILMGTAFIEQF